MEDENYSCVIGGDYDGKDTEILQTYQYGTVGYQVNTTLAGTDTDFWVVSCAVFR